MSPSHVFPKNPCLQSQSKPSVLGVHVPSFLHGDEWQKLNSIDRKMYGAITCHVNLVSLSLPLPPFSFLRCIVRNSYFCWFPPTGIFNPVMFTLKYLFLIFVCSAPLTACYNHLPRVNKEHLLFLFYYLEILFPVLYYRASCNPPGPRIPRVSVSCLSPPPPQSYNPVLTFTVWPQISRHALTN